MTDLTEKQRAVLAHIVGEYVRGYGLPSQRDLMPVFGWRSVNAAHDVLAALVKKGALRHRPGRKNRRVYGLVLEHPEVRALIVNARGAAA